MAGCQPSPPSSANAAQPSQALSNGAPSAPSPPLIRPPTLQQGFSPEQPAHCSNTYAYTCAYTGPQFQSPFHSQPQQPSHPSVGLSPEQQQQQAYQYQALAQNAYASILNPQAIAQALSQALGLGHAFEHAYTQQLQVGSAPSVPAGGQSLVNFLKTQPLQSQLNCVRSVGEGLGLGRGLRLRLGLAELPARDLQDSDEQAASFADATLRAADCTSALPPLDVAVPSVSLPPSAKRPSSSPCTAEHTAPVASHSHSVPLPSTHAHTHAHTHAQPYKLPSVYGVAPSGGSNSTGRAASPHALTHTHAHPVHTASATATGGPASLAVAHSHAYGRSPSPHAPHDPLAALLNHSAPPPSHVDHLSTPHPHPHPSFPAQLQLQTQTHSHTHHSHTHSGVGDCGVVDVYRPHHSGPTQRLMYKDDDDDDEEDYAEEDVGYDYDYAEEAEEEGDESAEEAEEEEGNGVEAEAYEEGDADEGDGDGDVCEGAGPLSYADLDLSDADLQRAIQESHRSAVERLQRSVAAMSASASGDDLERRQLLLHLQRLTAADLTQRSNDAGAVDTDTDRQRLSQPQPYPPQLPSPSPSVGQSDRPHPHHHHHSPDADADADALSRQQPHQDGSAPSSHSSYATQAHQTQAQALAQPLPCLVCRSGVSPPASALSAEASALPLNSALDSSVALAVAVGFASAAAVEAPSPSPAAAADPRGHVHSDAHGTGTVVPSKQRKKRSAALSSELSIFPLILFSDLVSSFSSFPLCASFSYIGVWACWTPPYGASCFARCLVLRTAS